MNKQSDLGLKLLKMQQLPADHVDVELALQIHDSKDLVKNETRMVRQQN
jgi:hypothetical protein